MSKMPSLIEFLQEQLVAFEKKHGPLSNTHRKFILLGVEFDEDSFPEIVMNRSVGTYATQIAGLQLLEDMVHEEQEKLRTKLSEARKNAENASKPSVPSPESRPEVESFLQSLRDKLKAAVKEKKSLETSEEDKKVEEVLKNIKSQFGFDGPGGFKGDFSLKTSSPDDDDDE